MTSNQNPQNPKSLQPLDRAAIALIAVLSVVIGGLLVVGDHASARVRDFSWQDRQVGAENAAFIMTFSRPMDPASIEENLKIQPSLPGRFSWAGRRMAYTLDVPAPYGESFEVSLDQARDRFSAATEGETNFQPFRSQFETRDRAFAYIGLEGEEQGRLVLYNLTRGNKSILTPPNQVILDFKPYPLGDRILFSATDSEAYRQGLFNQELYSVTTGLNPIPPSLENSGRGWFKQKLDPKPRLKGKVTPILDSKDYQNLKFDLSPDGKTIVVQRVNRENPAEFGPWIVAEGEEPRPLKTDPGGDFLIAPDSQTLVMLQGEGVAIIPLTQEADSTSTTKPLDFLPQYGRVFDLASDGSAAAMVNFNQNDPEQRFTESLFWVTNRGDEKELLRTTGSILDAQFDPTHRIIFCLATQLLPGDTYVEKPFLTAVDIETGELKDLLALPPQATVSISLAPDGLALLFDQTMPGDPNTDGGAIAASHLWILPLFATPAERLAATPVQIPPQKLPIKGIHPIWLP
ncbi:MAG: hypothetical protein QNJ46_13660 [Leptolyngbyaceae cyanobacterium MO_188.B28]|nr:hypothetical protein [Leptolyngbyaceae cyanobacterium MO_188.B28]